MRDRLTNTAAAFALLRAARALLSITDSGLDVDDPRVQLYLERLSAAKHRPIADLADCTLRELEALGRAVEKSLAALQNSPLQPGGVIPGCTDSPTARKPRKSRGKHAVPPIGY